MTTGRFGVLCIFRHAPRQWSIEFPRGFAEDRSLTAVENVRKELSEEEGIGGFQWVCEERFREMIRNGDITDGFTLSAYAQLLCTDKS